MACLNTFIKLNLHKSCIDLRWLIVSCDCDATALRVRNYCVAVAIDKPPLAGRSDESRNQVIQFTRPNGYNKSAQIMVIVYCLMHAKCLLQREREGEKKISSP
jgi:hypothetical protein